ncbi:MAG: phosphatase PAP2 family protein [Ginsengibacter sp.]
MKKYVVFLMATLCFQLSSAQIQTSDFVTLTEPGSVLGTAGTTFQKNTFHQFGLHSRHFKNPVLGIPVGEKAPQDIANSPYKTSLVKDGLVLTGAVGVTLLGYELIKNKSDLTSAELANKTKDKLPFFDRGAAGNYSDQANKDSYILFDASYALPFVAALIDKNERAKFGQVAVLYLETIAITGSMYTLSAGLVYRSRPFVYGSKAPLDKRMGKGGQRSFYGGHVATTAASTFFIAKVFHDFNPGSKVTPYLYVASGGLTALMGYFRVRSGYHFPSDCVLSSVIGAATGILIPQFHKSKNFANVSLTPEIFNNGTSGFALNYRF